MAVMECRIGSGIDLLFDVADTASSAMIASYTPRGTHVVQAAASQERQEAKSGHFWQRRLLRMPGT
jgi:hypothetical protein